MALFVVQSGEECQVQADARTGRLLHSKKSLLGNLSVHVLESFPSITLVTILSYPHESSDLRVSGKILGLG